MIVVDASSLLQFLLYDVATVEAVADAVAGEHDGPLHAPELIELEVLQALRRLVRVGTLSVRDARTTLSDLAATRLQRHHHAPLRSGVWALRDRLTAYDASYVVLAERLGADLLLTGDAGMAAVARDVLGAERVRLV